MMRKLQKFKVLFIAILTIIVIVLLLPVLRNLRPSPPSQSVEIQLSQERIQLMSPESVIKLMNIQPGSVILDLGAGRGLFTFPLAEAVGSQGKVFSADVDPQIIDFLKQQSKQKGFKNVIPVMVKPKGFDEFYQKNTFDIILASEVVPIMSDPKIFFIQLASSLEPEKGRLWVINLRLDSDFNAIEFGDFKVMSEILNSKEIAKPLVNRLSTKTREALANETGKNISESLQKLLIKDLNRMLDDYTLYPEFSPSIFDPKERQLREYLVSLLNQEGVFESKDTKISNTALPNLRLLNRIVIQDILKTRVWEKAFSLDQLSWEQWEGLLRGRNKMPILLEMPEYELVKQHPVLIYHDVWELKRK